MSEGEISSSERATCPKCGHKRDKGASACPRCGLRFALWRPSLADPRTHLSPQGQELWQQVEANWQDVARHEEFAKYCPRPGVATVIDWTAFPAMPSPPRCRPRFWPKPRWA